MNSSLDTKQTEQPELLSNKVDQKYSGLCVEGLGKAFRKRVVLSDVTFNLQKGEVVGLLGPNGAGKTTSFYMVCGLLTPDQGRIWLNGKEITALPMYRRSRLGIGYLPQEPSIFRGMNVEQNIRAILQVTEPDPAHQEAVLEELLADFSIEHLRKSAALSLSGGERRRVEIARALAARPDFILLDEPFAGVDPIVVGDIRRLVSQLKNRGIGVLITDHNVRETLSVVDRAYIIFDGRVLMSGKPSEIIANEQVKAVYLGDSFTL